MRKKDIAGATFEEIWSQEFQKLDPSASAPYAEYEGRPSDYIKEVLGLRMTPQQEEAVECIVNNRMVVMQSSTAVGKSFIMAAMTWYFRDVYYGRGVQIYCLAAPPVQNLRRILWGNILSIGRKYRGIDKRLIRDLRVNGPTDNEYIEGISIPTQGSDEEKESKASGKHAPFLIFLVDEADAVPDVIFKGIDGCGSGGELVRIVCSFNPKKRFGYVYNAIASNSAKTIRLCSFDHPNVIEGRDVFPGAVTRNYVIDKINEWTTPVYAYEVKWDFDSPPSGVFWLPDYLNGTVSTSETGTTFPPLMGGWRKVTNPEFSYKILGEYPPSGDSQLLPQEHLEGSIARWLMTKKELFANLPVSAGIDISDAGGDECCISFMRGMHYHEETIAFPGSNVNDGSDTIIDYCRSRNVTKAFFDGVGMGKMYADTVSEKLKERGLAIEVVVVDVSKKEKAKFRTRRDRLYWRLRNWVMNPLTCLCDNGELRRQMQIVRWEEGEAGRIVVTGKKQMRAILGKSPNEMESLLMLMDRGGAGYFRI
jgi:hypothetical protein